jgi:outer membrane beta-barrel protein
MKPSIKTASHASKSIAVLPRLIAVVLGMALSVPAIGNAQPEEDEENTATSLARQPAVRHRLLLVKGRFEATPVFEATLNADYRHTIGGGLKLEYHISDMFSFGVVGVASKSFNTGLTNKILATLPPDDQPPPEGDPTPTKGEFEQHLNSMPLHGAAYASITPWYGKLAAFGKAFVNFDFYFQGGVAVARLTNTCSPMVCSDPYPGGATIGDTIIPPDDDPNNDPALNDGLRLGVYMGGGIHVFLNNWMALDLTVRDYLFSNNPSGLDFDADLAVTDTDSRLLNHLFIGVGLSIFLPFRAERTN